MFINFGLIIIAFVAQLSLTSYAQGTGWQAYSPPEDGFKIEFPSALRVTKTAGGGNEGGLDRAVLAYYEAKTTSDDESRFKVIVINGRDRDLGSMPRDEALTYLSVMLIGDDDDPEPTSKANISVNGLTGKEYIYSKESKVFEYGRTNEIFKRGRVFDLGDKIYAVVFVGRDAKDLKSPEAEHFFGSFRLGKPNRK